MRRILRSISVFLPVLVLLTLANFAFSQDAATNCADSCKVVLDNDQVRVIEYHVKPGVKIPMHSHPANVTYFVTPSKMKTTTPDGKSTEAEPKVGEARWSDGVTHANENVGTKESYVIVVEIKKK